MRDEKHLELMIEALLADPDSEGNPLRFALAELYDEYRGLLHEIDRVARTSDRYQSMMRDLKEALKETSAKDPLTGIGNRRMLMENLKAETARAERLERPLTVVLIDVDRFKSVNDAYGHETGDKVLVRIAHAIRDGVRNYDLCGRWGGEEFMVIMPEITAAKGAGVVERIRVAIAGGDLVTEGDLLQISASFGVAERKPGETISDTINRADSALFEAKRKGRNRYEVAG